MVVGGNLQAGVVALGVATTGEGASGELAQGGTPGHRQHRRAALIQAVRRRTAQSLLWWVLIAHAR